MSSGLLSKALQITDRPGRFAAFCSENKKAIGLTWIGIGLLLAYVVYTLAPFGNSSVSADVILRQREAEMERLERLFSDVREEYESVGIQAILRPLFLSLRRYMNMDAFLGQAALFKREIDKKILMLEAENAHLKNKVQEILKGREKRLA